MVTFARPFSHLNVLFWRVMMPRTSSEEGPETQGPPEEQEASATDDAPPATGTDVINPHRLSRRDLERKIRGAMRRSRMPGSHGKQGAKDAAHLKKVHAQRFPGLKIRFWDSLPPPPTKKPYSPSS